MTRQRPTRLKFARSGLTFLEVMFAVIILGIGMIMVAGIFPVAMQQQQATMDESQTIAITDGALATLRVLAEMPLSLTPPLAPPGPFDQSNAATPPEVFGFSPSAWTNVIAGNVINSDNPHYAWTALYTRASATSNASVLLFALASRNHAAFESAELTQVSGNLSDLQPQPINVTVNAYVSPGSNTITLNSGQTGAACEGAYIVIADGTLAGQVYRLGTLVDPTNPTSTQWYVSPDYDVASSVTAAVTANAWILGRGYKDYTNPSLGYAGPCQVIGIRFADKSQNWSSVNITGGY